MPSAREHLTPADTAWLRMEERGNPVDIVSLLRFAGELSEDRLRDVLLNRLLVHRRFRQRVLDTPFGIAAPHWEDEPAFSIEDHLRRSELPRDAGDAELQALIGELISEPIDFSRSPWRVHLVQGLRGGTAVICRIHHCMGDGFALIQILLSLTDTIDGTLQTSRAGTSSHAHARLANIAHLAGDGIKALGHLLLLSFDTPNSIRGALSGHRLVTWCRPIPLARVKTIGKARRVTVNDVLLAAISGALRRYLDGRGDAVDELVLRAIVPVNLRPADKPIDLEHGNWFGLLFVDLPVQSSGSDDRVAAINETTQRIKASQEAIISLAVLNAMGRAPAAVEHVLDDVFARKGSLVVTNVPGPQHRLWLGGSEIEDIVFWAPHSGRLALGISILSYAGNIRIGIRSDGAVVADPDRLAQYVEAEIDTLGSGNAGPAGFTGGASSRG